MSESREVELKLEVVPGEVPRFRESLARLGLGEGTKQHLASVYFDTPNQALRKEGVPVGN